MRLIASLLLPLLAGGVLAADAYGSTPVFLELGGTYLSQDMRSAFATDWGIHAGVSALIAESALFGMPSADLDLRYASSHGSAFTAFATSYAERRLIDERIWLGLGVGAEYLRVKITPRPPAGSGALPATSEERKWAMSGKGMLGFLITQRFFVEGTYHYSPKVNGLETAAASISLGYWF